MKQTQRILLSTVLILICFVVYQQKIDLVDLRTKDKNIAQSITKIENDVYAKLDLFVLDSCGIITNGYGHGSCVMISPNLVLTAGHCIDKANTWIEIGEIKYDIKSKSKWKSKKSDVGFVIIDSNLPYLTLGNDPVIQDEIYIVGTSFDVAFLNKVSKGFVCKTNLNYTQVNLDWTDNFICDALAGGGNSGGPVLDINGKIVGIYVGFWQYAENFGVCVPVSKIKEALKDRNECY